MRSDVARWGRCIGVLCLLGVLALPAAAGPLVIRIGHATKPGLVEPIFRDDQPVTLEELQRTIGDLTDRDAQVIADPNADFNTVDKVMELLQMAGAGAVSLKREPLPVALAVLPQAADSTVVTSATADSGFMLTFRPQPTFHPHSDEEMTEAFTKDLPKNVRTHHLRFKIDEDGPTGYVIVDGRAGAETVRLMLLASDQLSFAGMEPATPLTLEMLDKLKDQGPAPRAPEKREPPRVTFIAPDPGDTEVSVSLAAIRVTFNEDMDTSYSWVGSGPDFPPLRAGERPRWIDGRTCIYPAALEAGRFYRMGINSKTAQGFRAAKDKLPARPALTYFVTDGASIETLRRGLKPQVVRMEPMSGEGDVDPLTRELRVTFNVEMRPESAWVGEGEHFPEPIPGEDARWSDDRKTCSLPVRLESDWEYQLALNGGGRNDFQSAAGVPLDPMFWTFQTRKTPGAADAATTQTRTLGVAVDPRVELLSIIFRLAGNQEYNRGAVASYNEDVDRWFGGRKNHPAIQLARKLRQNYDIRYSAPMFLAIRMPEPMGDIVGAVPWQIDTRGMDPQWPARELAEFCEQARRFAQLTRFDKFFADHAELYDTAATRARRVIMRDVRLDWFDKFFGARPGADFRIVIAPLLGGINYGPKRHKGTREECYCILGIWFADRYGDPAFSREASGVVAHEFDHSYVNPVVERHLRELRPAAETLFPRVAGKLRRQAYGHWEAMVIESLVRAAQARYVRDVRGQLWGMKAIKEEEGNGFIWTAGLVALFDDYEKERKKYPTYESFMPRVVAFFNQEAKKPSPETDKLRPAIVALEPADGALNVDPALAKLRVTFDRPMAPGFSWVGGGASYPEVTGVAHWSDDRKSCILPVKLKPGRDYELSLNSDYFENFRDPRGTPIEPTPWKFRTKE